MSYVKFHFEEEMGFKNSNSLYSHHQMRQIGLWLTDVALKCISGQI